MRIMNESMTITYPKSMSPKLLFAGLWTLLVFVWALLLSIGIAQTTLTAEGSAIAMEFHLLSAGSLVCAAVTLGGIIPRRPPQFLRAALVYLSDADRRLFVGPGIGDRVKGLAWLQCPVLMVAATFGMATASSRYMLLPELARMIG